MEPSFQSILFSDLNEHAHIVQILVDAFKKRRSKSKKQHVLEVLCGLFRNFQFDLNRFLVEYRLNESQKDKFLSYLLSEIYYREDFFASIDTTHPTEYLESFCLILFAETQSKEHTQEVLASLSTTHKIRLIGHCCCHLREGAWKILDILELENEWKGLIGNLRSHYYDAFLLRDILQQEQGFSLQSIVKTLEEDAEKYVQDIMRTLPMLVDLLFRNQLVNQLANLIPLFTPYLQDYTLEEAKALFCLFGLHDFFLDIPILKFPFAPLDIILKEVVDLLRNPSNIQQEHVIHIIALALGIYKELYAFNRDPVKYLPGLKNLVYATATRGEHFSDLAWLPSVVAGLDTITKHLQDKGVNDIKVSDIPIIIFDQAPAKVFANNQIFIQNLSKTSGSTILHLSRQQTLRIANKLGLKKWIVTALHGKSFGYGGARNALFLLAPVIHHAYQQGKRTLDAILNMPIKEIRLLFDSAVMGKNGQDAVVHMGEDDVAIPACNIFAETLFADSYKAHYFSRYSYCIGRDTINVYAPLDAETVINKPEVLFYSTKWQSIPVNGGMKGMTTKPRFCLPLPFGNEENHTKAPFRTYDPFQQPVVHLGGTRYPQKLYPISPFDGIVPALKTILPHVMQISLSSTILDPKNKWGHSALPWNDEVINTSERFHCLADLLNFAFLPTTQEELKKRVWHNLGQLFKDSPPADFPAYGHYRALTNLQFPQQVPIALKRYYEVMQRDALMFFSLGKRLTQSDQIPTKESLKEIKADIEKEFNIQIEDTQLTQDLYRLVEVLMDEKDLNDLRDLKD